VTVRFAIRTWEDEPSVRVAGPSLPQPIHQLRSEGNLSLLLVLRRPLQFRVIFSVIENVARSKLTSRQVAYLTSCSRAPLP
jgi:hypothetical protein